MSIATRRLWRSAMPQWLSGASGTGVTKGSTAFGDWRGTAVTVAASWSDVSPASQQSIWQFGATEAYPDWQGSLDLAIGAIWKTDASESWAAAAAGAYDTRWTASLTKARTGWLARQRATLYIRFAHELNGNWFQWSVSAAETADFIAAWQRFRGLQQSVFPESKLVFCTNGNTAGFSYDWRTLWPGDAYVDVYATDWYSPQWALNSIYPTGYDNNGGPVRLDRHREFAAAHNKPFALSEWGLKNDAQGDNTTYIQYVYDFCKQHGGFGAGKLLYECYFNVRRSQDPTDIFRVYTGDPVPENPLAPNAAALYKQLF